MLHKSEREREREGDKEKARARDIVVDMIFRSQKRLYHQWEKLSHTQNHWEKRIFGTHFSCSGKLWEGEKSKRENKKGSRVVSEKSYISNFPT